MKLYSLRNAADFNAFEAHRAHELHRDVSEALEWWRSFCWVDLIFEPGSWFLGAFSFVTDIKEATLWSFSKTEADIKETSFDKLGETISTRVWDWKFQASIIYTKMSEGSVYLQTENRTASNVAMATHRLMWLILADRSSAVLFLF